MSAITTHVLDTTSGRPAADVPVKLELRTHSAGWQLLAESSTDADGRVKDLIGPGQPLLTGHYRLTFEVGPHFLLAGQDTFFPQVSINFTVKNADQHYHVPLLVSPFGFTTYRGT